MREEVQGGSLLVKAAIYDFDGPINDSFREGLRRIKILCAIHDVPFDRDARSKLIGLWGIPGVELLTQALHITPELAAAMYVQWEKMDLTDPVPLVPAAKDVLYWMRRCGFANALLTTRNRQNVTDIFERLDLTREFAVISCRQDVAYRKPDPRAFAYVLDELAKAGIAKDDCIFLGDTPADIEAGRQAAIRTLVVQTGPYLLKHAAEHPVPLSDVLGSIDDLPGWMAENHEGPLPFDYK